MPVPVRPGLGAVHFPSLSPLVIYSVPGLSQLFSRLGDCWWRVGPGREADEPRVGSTCQNRE